MSKITAVVQRQRKDTDQTDEHLVRVHRFGVGSRAKPPAQYAPNALDDKPNEHAHDHQHGSRGKQEPAINGARKVTA